MKIQFFKKFYDLIFMDQCYKVIIFLYYILVLKSKCNTYEGLSGIVLKDNMRSFEIIT